jgi:hypothetical protein
MRPLRATRAEIGTTLSMVLFDDLDVQVCRDIRNWQFALDLACWDHRPDFSATFTTIAFDDSSLQRLGISNLIAEPEGPSFVQLRNRGGSALLVTQGPLLPTCVLHKVGLLVSAPAPAIEAVVRCRIRAVFRWTILPTTSHLQHMDDPAQNPSLILRLRTRAVHGYEA